MKTWPIPMSIVRQEPDSGHCLACCCAMLTGTTLSHVLGSVLMRRRKAEGLEYLPTMEAAKFLMKYWLLLGGLISYPKPHRFDDNTLSGGLDMVDVDRVPAVVGVVSKTRPGGQHAVVWDPMRRAILDPQHHEPMELTGYDVVDWTPVTNLEEMG